MRQHTAGSGMQRVRTSMILEIHCQIRLQSNKCRLQLTVCTVAHSNHDCFSLHIKKKKRIEKICTRKSENNA